MRGLLELGFLLLIALAPAVQAEKAEAHFEIRISPDRVHVPHLGSANATVLVEGTLDCQQPLPGLGSPRRPEGAGKLYVSENVSYRVVRGDGTQGYAFRNSQTELDLSWSPDASVANRFRVRAVLNLTISNTITPPMDIDARVVWEISEGGGAPGVCTMDGYRNVFQPRTLMIQVDGDPPGMQGTARGTPSAAPLVAALALVAAAVVRRPRAL